MFYQKSKSDYRRGERRDARPARPAYRPHEEGAAEERVPSGAVIGRNAVRELLKSGRTVDKLLVQSGEREGALVPLVGEAIARGIPVVETDRAKLDKIAGYVPHQGIIAMAA